MAFRSISRAALVLLLGTSVSAHAQEPTSACQNLFAQKTYASAFSACLDAAEKGDLNAAYRLGHMYAEGKGVAPNPQNAYKFYRMAAERGHVSSQVQLALMLLDGKTVAKDLPAAQRWLKKAANRGNSTAQYTLGLILSDSEPRESARWYQKAAKQGNGFAMHNLSLFHLYGRGVEQSTLLALRLAERSIAAGVTESEGLKQQILQLMGEEIPPASDYVVIRDQRWLAGLHEEAYLLRLQDFESKKQAYRFLDTHKLQGKAGIFRAQADGKTRYLITYGDYADRDAAQHAVQSLPGAVARTAPEILRFADLQAIAAPTRGAHTPVVAAAREIPARTAETPKPAPAQARIKTDREASTSAESGATAAQQVAAEGTKPSTKTGKKTAVANKPGRKTGEWLLAKPKKKVIIQLMAVPSSRRAEIERYIERNKLQGNTVFYETQRDAGPYTVLLYAKEFTLTADARAEIKKMPKGMRNPQPWVRNYSALQALYRPLK